MHRVRLAFSGSPDFVGALEASNSALLIVNPDPETVFAGATASQYAVDTVFEGDSVVIDLRAFGIGGDGEYSYSWSPTTGLDDPSIADPTLTISDIGQIAPTEVIRTVTITDRSGSSNTARVLIKIGCPFC